MRGGLGVCVVAGGMRGCQGACVVAGRACIKFPKA